MCGDKSKSSQIAERQKKILDLLVSAVDGVSSYSNLAESLKDAGFMVVERSVRKTVETSLTGG